MKYNVYVLKSLLTKNRYIGITSKNPKDRLYDHNTGSNQFTRKYKPWYLLYYELDYCKECAFKREAFLKSGQGRRILDMIVQFQPKADQPMAGA